MADYRQNFAQSGQFEAIVDRARAQKPHFCVRFAAKAIVNGQHLVAFNTIFVR
jgi:hypothetical protein